MTELLHFSTSRQETLFLHLLLQEEIKMSYCVHISIYYTLYRLNVKKNVGQSLLKLVYPCKW